MLNYPDIYIYIYIYTHTHTHTYIYIYIYIGAAREAEAHSRGQAGWVLSLHMGDLYNLRFSALPRSWMEVVLWKANIVVPKTKSLYSE
jgi:hypothetical protein